MTLEEFEIRARESNYRKDAHPSDCVAQENALFNEAARLFMLLLICNHLGIVVRS